MPYLDNIPAKRIFNYLLSLIGLDQPPSIVYASSNSEHQHHVNPTTTAPSSSSSSSLSATDAWTLQSWVGGLSKAVLCQIVWSCMMEYHDLWPIISSEQQKLLQQQQEQDEQKEQEQEENIQEITTIEHHAKEIARRLDALRPSEQFVHAAQVAQEYHQLIRLSSSLQHPLAAAVAIILLIQQSLTAAPEVRQHVYYQAKLGRLAVLEIGNVLKRQVDDPSRMLSVTHPSLVAFLRRVGWKEQLQDVCARLERYDTTWEFRHEYDHVVQLAERYPV
ncbi:predicted protein [Lichtheimia corymbifera JMRC:FSU:9682]|uniref:Uncharacterized protein n=2 Tax=Lichtheimia corymbifera JMRC:FSU:9682 TaxID=1263082 RepID=A0A068S453_9FUNG|nr:predicted protein [Lichtheimia corymbifera JMRC:FSU:9682]